MKAAFMKSVWFKVILVATPLLLIGAFLKWQDLQREAMEREARRLAPTRSVYEVVPRDAEDEAPVAVIVFETGKIPELRFEPSVEPNPELIAAFQKLAEIDRIPGGEGSEEGVDFGVNDKGYPGAFTEAFQERTNFDLWIQPSESGAGNPEAGKQETGSQE